MEELERTSGWVTQPPPGSRQRGAVMRAVPEPNLVTSGIRVFSPAVCVQGILKQKGCFLLLPVRVGWVMLQKQITPKSQGFKMIVV